jgi:signal transduction histidine kinase
MLLSASESLADTSRPVVASSNIVEFPVPDGFERRVSVQEVGLALATADDFPAVLTHLVDWLQRRAEVSRAEWWGRGGDGAPELVAAAGPPHATRHTVPMGPAAELVLHGRRLDPGVVSELSALRPILRRRVAEEQLTRTAMQLARRNEALEDFAALVAHELKTPLHAALIADDPSVLVEQALNLVDALLQAARDDSPDRTSASVAESLDLAAEDLAVEIAITSGGGMTLPLAAGALRVILRNLISNAIAAGAHHVDVTAERSTGSLRLLVDDDGNGLVDIHRYAHGSGLGLSLSRRIARRFGGRLQLTPRPSGGTRATLEFREAVA